MKKQLYLKTFGCQMNEYDSEKIKQLLKNKNSMETTDSPENADFIVLNTCSVREKAEVKVYSDLGRYRKLKENNPNLRIAVGGCVASQEGENIIKKAPFVDLVFGPQTLHRLPEMLEKRERQGFSQIDVSFPEIEKFDNLPITTETKPCASVSIMEGCSKYCSFCVVPYTRGEEISRPLDEIIEEIIRLTLNGVKEVTLLGQNVNAYRGLMADGKIADFAMLLEYVSSIRDIKRIRFTTSHPNEMTDNLIECFKNIDKLSKFLHLPIQSGSDRILSAMKRNYTVLEYKSIIRKLKKVCPEVTLSSDFIIGFPNETESEFNETKKILQDINFDYSFSFLYSPRPGTPASFIEDNIPKDIKEKRLHEFKELNNQLGKQFTKNMIGTKQRVLIDSLSNNNQNRMKGKTDNNRIVEVDYDEQLFNELITVEIKGFTGKNLFGIAVKNEN